MNSAGCCKCGRILFLRDPPWQYTDYLYCSECTPPRMGESIAARMERSTMFNLEVIAAGVSRDHLADMLDWLAGELRRGLPPTGAEREAFVTDGLSGSYWLQGTEAEQASWSKRKG